VKNRILFVSLAVVLAAGLGLVGCGGPTPEPEGPETVMVGMARDLNEDLVFFECNAAGPVVRWFVDKVNCEGGVHLSEYDTDTEDWYADIELVVRDFSLATWDIGTVTQGLIDDGADFIWGGPATDTIYTQAPICNAAAVPLITLEGGASKMVWEHESYLDVWPYVWVTLSFANWYEIPVLYGMIDAEVDTPTAYCTYIGQAGAEHGLEYFQETENQFGAENVIDAGAHAYTLDSEAANTIIQSAKSALNTTPYDIFCAWTYPWNVAELIGACIANDFNPPAIAFGPGGNFESYSSVYFGPMMEGILSFTMANNKTEVAVGTPTMTMDELYDAIAAQIEDDWANVSHCPQGEGFTSGYDQLDWWGHPCYAAALEMWKYAVEEVGDVDGAEVRNVLASYTPADPATTVFGDTWYAVFPEAGGNSTLRTGGGVMDYLCHTGEIGQWQSGIFETVGYDGITGDLPNYDVTADFVFPMTDQWTWLLD